MGCFAILIYFIDFVFLIESRFAAFEPPPPVQENDIKTSPKHWFGSKPDWDESGWFNLNKMNRIAEIDWKICYFSMPKQKWSTMHCTALETINPLTNRAYPVGLVCTALWNVPKLNRCIRREHLKWEYWDSLVKSFRHCIAPVRLNSEIVSFGLT